MRVSLTSVNGVASVDVSLEKGLATVKLKPGNLVTLKQLQSAISKNGFTMKQSRVTATGKVIQSDGAPKFQISGSNEVVNLVPESQSHAAPPISGLAVLLEGTVLQAAKNKSPDSVQYRSLTQEK